MRVESGTQEAYERVRRFFGEWLIAQGYEPRSPEEFDRRGEEYVTHVYDDGLPGYHACQLVAAMELYHPLSKGRWVLTGGAAAGFRRVNPGGHWPPLPAEVVLAAAACLWSWRRPEEAVALLLGFHCYLRIAEVVGLMKELVVLPGDAEESVPASITIEDAKTGGNQTVRLDSEFIIGLVKRHRESNGEVKLFARLTEDSFRKWLKKALKRLGLEDEGYVTHSLRHGGAARDYHHGFRSREEVKTRG
jgi:integrase